MYVSAISQWAKIRKKFDFWKPYCFYFIEFFFQIEYLAFEVIVVSTWKNGFVYWFFFRFFVLYATYISISFIHVFICVEWMINKIISLCQSMKTLFIKITIFFYFFAEEHLYGKMEDQKEFSEDVTHGLMPDFPGLNLKETEIVWLFWIMFTKIGLNIMMLLVTIRNLPFANALEENEKNLGFKSLSFSISHAIYWTWIRMK